MKKYPIFAVLSQVVVWWLLLKWKQF